ncbi:MAG: DUF799 family lipoprotein [Cyclobacteriaceae bacterium]|jgi:hypothetical protein|nr:DUF799 family lipoprotein [Cyclobacteriaceae bacterium]
MKRKLVYLFAIIFMASSCAPSLVAPEITKNDVYGEMYKESPQTILVLLPINKTGNVEAKEFFYATLTTTLSDRGYYIMPPFISQEILRRESANDSEQFVDSSLKLFGDVFGADAIFFTIIHDWKKDGVTSKVEVTVEYILKSAKTNQVLFHRKGNLIYDTTIKAGKNASLTTMILASIASKVNTVATSYVSVARMCNDASLLDMPAGKYNANHKIDSAFAAGKKEFSTTIK